MWNDAQPQDMRRSLLLLIVLAGLVGCGDSVPDREVVRGTPGVTVGGKPYQDGGADGSGADGKNIDAPRGGVAAGPDSKEPGKSSADAP
jgi:hypothetical protein